jgi:transcriptional regulator with XRE-family HTH domain
MQSPGEAIRTLRNRLGLTLKSVSERTGMAVSTLSKLEKGHISLSYDKLMTLSQAFGVDMAELLGPSTSAPATGGNGRRVIQRAGEGYDVETRSYKQKYLATDLLNKLGTPLIAESRIRTLDEFVEEFGGLIHHQGEEFAYVLQGEIEFHTELYAPVRLKAGDSVYFDSEMGHAYLKAADEPCVVLAVCCPRKGTNLVMDEFKSASERLASDAKAKTAPAQPKGAHAAKAKPGRK